MKIRHAVLSDVGRKRKGNEDSFVVDAELGLYVVADGMGGHAAGEVASRLAVDVVHEVVAARWTPAPEPVPAHAGAEDPDTTRPPRGYDPDETGPVLQPIGQRPHGPELLRLAISVANTRVVDAAREKREHRGMASTVVAVLVDGDVAHVAHAGDSRIYRIREGVLEALTIDHSWVGEQIQAGALTADEARTHPLRNMVTRAVGGRAELEADARTVRIGPGELLLLCSDGLTGMVPDADIVRIAEEGPDPDTAVRRLVDEANERGGLDNITALLIQLDRDEA